MNYKFKDSVLPEVKYLKSSNFFNNIKVVAKKRD